MPKNTLNSYLNWLEKELDYKAESISAEVRSSGESPSEKKSAEYFVLRNLWDAGRIILFNDTAYRYETFYWEYSELLKEEDSKWDAYLDSVSKKFLLNRFDYFQKIKRIRMPSVVSNEMLAKETFTPQDSGNLF